MIFLVLVYVFNFDLFEFSAAILEKGLFGELQIMYNLDREITGIYTYYMFTQ